MKKHPRRQNKIFRNKMKTLIYKAHQQFHLEVNFLSKLDILTSYLTANIMNLTLLAEE